MQGFDVIFIKMKNYNKKGIIIKSSSAQNKRLLQQVHYNLIELRSKKGVACILLYRWLQITKFSQLHNSLKH